MEPVAASDGPPGSTPDRIIRRLCDAWSQLHDSHSSEEIYQRKSQLEEFLEGYYRLSDEDRLQLDHVNRYENISSALSRQLLLLIYEICDPTVKRYVRRADSAATIGSSTNSSTIAETPPSDSDEPQCTTKLDRPVDEVTLPLDTESSESRCQWLKDFFLHGIGGLFLQTLSKIGAKDIANGREITAVLVRILPTTKWNNMDQGSPVTPLEPQKGYGEFVRGVLKMRTFNGDWRECMKRSGGAMGTSSALCRSLESTIGPTVTLMRQLSGPKVVADTIDFIQATQFRGVGGQQESDGMSGSQCYDTRLSQDQFTLTVLNLLESLIVHENVLTIDENSVTVSCLRAALEQLKRQEVFEESIENRLIIRHKLLGLVMLCLNNMFFLETLDSNDINLRTVATELLELLKGELRERSSDAVSCEFMYNLIYTIVSAVNQTFLHFCDNLVSEQLFMAIFKLLENNLDIIKHTYSLLQLRRPPLATGGNPWMQLAPGQSSTSGLIEILIKMLQNFIYALAPSRIGSFKRSRKCGRLRLHHSRQGARSGYVCALENLLLNLFPLVKHSDQRALATFFKSHQLCCCNTNVQTLEVLMKLSNDELIPKLRLNFASRAVVYAIFNRSQCETCESDRAANTFYGQFTRTHREVFREFRRVENRTRMPTFLRYLLDIVRAVPYRLRSFLLQELVLELLAGELDRFAATEPGAYEPLPSMDDSGREIINGCLVIVCRAVAEDERMIKFFYRDEMIPLLQVLSGRLEFVHSMHQIMTIGIHSQALEGKLEEILFTNIDNLVRYVGQLFEAITNCKLGLSLKSFTSADSTLNPRVEAPLETTLQLHLEHWKTLRHLLKENDRFRKRFFHHYGGVKGVQRFMDLAYNLVSVCVFPGATATRFDLPSSAPEARAFPDHGESVSVEPERRSVLNIFHFNDQLIDGTVSGASFYYSATDETITMSAGPKEVVGTPEEDEDYSFLRELRLASITGQWEVEYNALVNGYPSDQPTVSAGGRGRELFSKLEKKWSLSELFNIRQMLSELMDGYLPGSKDGVPKGLPKDARSLLLLDQRAGATVVRKKLTNLLEMILGSMQLLINGDVTTTIDDATVGSQSELESTMQIALLELKKLLMSNALSHWESPNTANDVMNVLQALLKVAEMRTEMIPPPPVGGDSIPQREVFPKRVSSCEEDDRLSDPPRSYHDEQDVQDDTSSTDESYTTAREDGYEGDVEIEPYSPQELLAKKEAKASAGKPYDSDRSLAVSEQICTIVTELLIELSARCVERPDHWCQALAQMIVKLNMIRTHLGGSLYLIRGFALVLRTNDSRLKELQASIMDLIVDLDNPQVLVKYVQLLGEKDPPVQLILTKLTNLFETTGSGLECYQSIRYPVVHANRTFSTTSDVLLAKKITFLREHHLFFNVRSGFTDAATIVPLNYANFYPWHGNGFTVALWMRVEQLADHPSQPEHTHLLSVGSEKQLLSVCFNSQRQLVVRYSKPDRVISPSNTKRYLGVAGARSECCENCAKEMQHLWTYKHLLRSITDGTPQPFVLDTAGAQCVYCFKQLPVGGPTRKGSQGTALPDGDVEGRYETSVLDVGNLRQCTIGQDWCVPEGIWTMLTLAVQQMADETIAVTMTLDGVQRLASLLLPNACRIHIDTDLTVLTVGHRASTPTECSVGYDLAGVHLFSKCITDEAALANLYAVGPNSSNFAAFANGSMIPNYGTLNLTKLAVDDLRTVASLQLLERTHLGYWNACKADSFVGRNAQTIGLMSFAGKLRVTEHNSLQRSLLVAGGVSVMLVCFARVVEISDSPALHAVALKLLLRIAHCNHDFFNEFVQCNYLELIGIVLKSKKCHKDIALLATLLEIAFDQPIVAKRADQYRVLPGSVARVRYPGMITFLLENFHIWIDQSEEVLDLLLSTLATVTRDKHPGMMYNCQRLQAAALVPALIDFCRVNFVIPAKTVKISRKAADLLVSLIAILSPTPPKVSLLNEIMELLLLMHKPTDSYVTHDRQKFYFNISSQHGASSSSSGGGKRGDKATNATQSVTGNTNLPGTPKMQLRDRRQLRPASQLRKILPLTISAGSGSSFDSATTSFIIDTSQNTSASTNAPNTSCSPPKSPKLASPGTEGTATEECYEKLNKALADGKRHRKSLLESIDKGSAKLKLRRLKSSPNIMRSSPSGRRKFGSGSPRFVTSSPKLLSQCTRNDLNRSGTDHHQSVPASSTTASSSSTLRYKFFEQNYFATGNDFLQESFLRVMCDFLLILPDSDARKFLSGENRILETLLILANNGNIRIRTMLLNLVAVIDDRIDGGGPGGEAGPGGTNAILQQYSEEQSKVFWYHLANQIGTHSVNGELIASCFRWITKSNVNPLLSVQGGGARGEESPLATLLQQQGTLEVIRENGLNVLIAILIQAHIDPPLFQCVLQLIEYICIRHSKRAGQYMIDNGLVWALAKTVVKMNEKEEHIREESRTYLLDFLTSFSHLVILSPIANPFWDLLNGLTVAQKHKSERVTQAVRDLHAALVRNVLQIFIFRPKQSIIGNKNTSFTVELVGSNLSKSEVKTRFNRLHDKAVQFVTNSDPEGELSDAEWALIRHLMNRTLNGNPRGGNIILWCLLPKRPIRLKLYTIRQLGQYLEGGGNHLSAICDVKMLKVFVQSILLLNQKHIPLEELRVVNAFYQSIDGGLSHGASWNLTQTLKDFEYLRTISRSDQEQMIQKSIARQEKLIYSCTVAAMQVTRNSVEKQNRLRKELIIQLRKDNDYRFYDQWHQLVGRLTHEDAPWYNGAAYPTSWELDDTYGPDMALKRMRRCPLTIDRRFLLKETQPEKVEDNGGERMALLAYLFPGDYQRAEYSVEEQVLYTFTVRKITPSRELECECIITSTELVLKPYDVGALELYDLHDITKIWTKRYEHQESAVEVFLKSGKSLFIVFDRDPSERATFEGFFHDLVVRYGRGELDYQTQLWREGALSNWEYLMLLNQVSGRTFHDLMQYPVFPWVLAGYDSPTLDLLAERTFRILEKPIAVQHRELEKHYINNYNHLRQAEESGDPSGAGGRRKIQPYHYSSHYSNSGTVLHFLVRVLPFTSLFLQYQDDSFDIPDRTFHSLQTTWNLASKDSPTDVKELIPEFFSFPEFLENQEGFDFGTRQSGEPVNHVELPPWCNGSARLFILIHRQALEAGIVRRQLAQWIDLIFGFKQTGQAAIDAINVFHPATYCDFSAADIDDPVMKLALETMVKTYGQMPRQLFDLAHPPPVVCPLGANPPTVLENVIGLRWGLYCGSPVLAHPKLVDVWERPSRDGARMPATLVALEADRMYAMPDRMNVFQGGPKKYYTVSWGEADDRLRIRPLQDNAGVPGAPESTRELWYGSNGCACDPITACGTDPNCTSIFFGHRSGRIAVFQRRTRRRRVSFFNQHMQPSVTMMARSRSTSFRRWIDRKSANLRRKLELDPDDQQQQQQQHSQQSQYQQHQDQPDGDQMDWNYPILLLKHRAPIGAIRISMEYKIVVSVSIDGCAAIWDVNSLTYVREIPQPVNMLHSMITQVAISPTLGDIVLVHSNANGGGGGPGRTAAGGPDSWSSGTLVEEDDSFEVTENYNVDYVNITMATTTTNRRDQLRLYTINAQYVEHVFLESLIRAVTYSTVKEGCGVNCIVVALESGIVRFYSSWNLALLREVNVEPNGIKCVIFSKNQHLLLMTGNGTVQTWSAEGLPGPLPSIQEPYQFGG
ncbi:AGAP004144-PA-like protein [Anopheles sinensis]|uniref:AGAP004144-PA-like protein n=1 Tax=Anopheles sinensis TaxID=74873 RepID=A0A084WTN0_ANOSI|nr:AGAP004144-PA-like protein [Anopheles sinensis]